MIGRRTVLAGAIACPFFSTTAVAQTLSNIVIGFAPPLGIDLHTVTKTSVVTGRAGIVSLSVNRRYRFSRNGRGYALTSAIESITDDAPPDLSHQLQANLAPLQGMALGFLLTDQGAMFALSDETLALLALQTATKTTVDQAPSSPLLHSIAAMTPEQQSGLLFNEARDLTRFAGRVVQYAAIVDDMAVIQTPHSAKDALRLSARVHVDSGISWLIERSVDPAHMPRHGVVATRMELLP